MQRSEPTVLAGKRIVLTGGSTGIGRSLLHLLAADQARVLTTARKGEALAAAVKSASDMGGDIEGIVADLSTQGGIDTLFEASDRLFGDGIDILIANAALGAEPPYEMADREWRYVVETNLMGYIACAREAIMRMQTAGNGGHLVFVSSISTDIKKPGESLYASTKAGIEALAMTLRKELQDQNIKITVVQPGSVRTPMQECDEEAKDAAVAEGEMLEPEDIAETIRFALTRPARVDLVNMRVEPIKQKRS